MPQVDAVTPEPSRRPGRPLSVEAGRAIVEATVAILAERGVVGLTMDEVAARAGVSKATIYRRWRSKEALVGDVIYDLAEELPVPDTGNVGDDLVGYLGALTNLWTRRHDAYVRTLSDIAADPPLRERFQRTLDLRRAAVRTILERGIARGEVRADLDFDVALDLMAGAATYRLVMTGAAITPPFVDDVVDLIVRGVGAR